MIKSFLKIKEKKDENKKKKYAQNKTLVTHKSFCGIGSKFSYQNWRSDLFSQKLYYYLFIFLFLFSPLPLSSFFFSFYFQPQTQITDFLSLVLKL